MTKRKANHRRYTWEFKEEVVKLAESKKLTLTEVGEKFGVEPSLINTWVEESRLNREVEELTKKLLKFLRAPKRS